jgi:hypothetical protein
MDIKEDLSLQGLARQLAVIDLAALEVDGQSSGVHVAGTTDWTVVLMPTDDVLWHSEEDERRQNESFDPIESVLDFVLRELEKRADLYKRIVERVRAGGFDEEE